MNAMATIGMLTSTNLKGGTGIWRGCLKLQDCKPEAFRKLPAALESMVSPLTNKIATYVGQVARPSPRQMFHRGFSDWI